MKKIALLFLIVSLSPSLFAQKGKITLGVDYHKMDNPYVYNSLMYPYGYYGPTYSFEPKVGYFISDNVELGLGFKSGDDEIDYEYASSNPSGNGEVYLYNNISKSSYRIFSPYLKYYKSNFFVSARLSLNSFTNEYDNAYPVWEADSVIGLDESDYKSTTTTKTTSLKIGYALKYNEKLIFEPSIGVSKIFGEVVNESTNTYADGRPPVVLPKTTSPISNATHFSVNLAVILRLGK